LVVDRLAMGTDRRALADHGRVDVDDAAVEAGDDASQQLDRVGVAPALVVGREVRADVACAGGAEDRVGDGVGEDVGVRVPDEPAVEIDLDATDEQALAGNEAMAVIADPDPDAHPSGSMVRSRPEKVAIRSIPSPFISSTACG
jgi:hypothetical protein